MTTKSPDTVTGTPWLDAETATEWLAAELSYGPVSAADIAVGAKAARIDKATLREARKRLNVETLHPDAVTWIVALPEHVAGVKLRAKAARIMSDRERKAAQIEADAVEAALADRKGKRK
jgi:hypothetical protein